MTQSVKMKFFFSYVFCFYISAFTLLTVYLYFVFFYLAAFKKHYALRLAIAPEFFHCSYMCLFYVCALGCWNKIFMYVCLSLVVSECSLSGRGQGHVSNFYIVGLENFATASRRYTGDIHNSSVVGLFMTPIRQWMRLERITVECTCVLHIGPP